MRRLILFLLVGAIAPSFALADPAPSGATPSPSGPDGDTIVYRATVPRGEWAGWNFDPDPHRSTPKPEQFEIVTSDGKSARIFSGKVVGLTSMDGVEVGLESLVGIPWIHPDQYQWEKVAPDGTFSITDARYLTADKAIGLRGPQTAWTFLRFNFAPNHAAKNIVLHAAPSKKVTVTASGPDMTNLTDLRVEVFDAYSQVDDRGNWLNRQQGGFYFSEDQPSLDLILPIGEVALFVHHDGLAGFYQIVDTRKADHFHFVLMPGGVLKIKTLDRNGAPRTGVDFHWKNPAAPLSYWAPKTDQDGEFLGKNLVPGTFLIEVPGYRSCRAEVLPSAETQVLLQEGKEPVISSTKLSSLPR